MTDEQKVKLEKQFKNGIGNVTEEDMDYANSKGRKKIESLADSVPEALADLWKDVKRLWRMVNAYVKKEYTEIPFSSIAAVVVALIYFISPIDFIPDVIPVAGYVDDAVVIGICLKMIKKDLDKFKEWEERR